MFWKGKFRKNKINLIVLVIFVIALIFVFVPNLTFAQTAVGNLEAVGSSAGLSNASLPTLLGNIVRGLLALLGLAAVLIMLYAGFIWMTAVGDPSKIEKAKKIMVGGIIGLVIITASFAIASFVMNAINGSISQNICDSTDTSEHVCNVCGVRTCQANGTWGACSMQRYECGTDPLVSPNSTYINKFSDEGSDLNGWRVSVRWNETRTISIPQSTTTASGTPSLIVGGYAKNSGGTITSMNLWVSSTNPWSLLGTFQNVSAVEELNNAYYSWNNSALATNTTTRLQIKTTLSGLGTEIVSNPIKTIIRARHCFNGVKDFNEIKIDCGGECGSCSGDYCDTNSDCTNGVCDLTTNTCAWPPHISSISPYTEIGSLNLPNGASGNYITILGNGFGTSSTLGSVKFVDVSNLDSSTQAIPPPAPCPITWTDNQIIVQIPGGLNAVSTTLESDIINNTSTNYLVTLNNGSLNSDNQVGFQVNNIDRPGICSINPNHGVYPSSTDIMGNKFTTGNSDVVWHLGAFVGASWVNGKQIGGTWQNINSTSTSSSWDGTTKVTDQIPNSSSGNMAKIRVYNGENYSNYFLFTLSNGLEGSFCGGSDERVCVTGDGACNSSLGLVCNHNSCTCQKSASATVCLPGTVTSTPTCSPIGSCTQVTTCNANGAWECMPKSDDPNCSPNIFMAQASQSLYAWGFKITDQGGLGQNCGVDVWGICDPRGCTGNTTCNTMGSEIQWVELYNSSSTAVSIADWKLNLFNNLPNGLIAYYPLYENTKEFVGNNHGTAGPELTFSSSSANFNGLYSIAEGFRAYVEMPSSSVPSLIGQEGTFSVWISTNIVTGNARHIIYFGQSSDPYGNGFGGSPEIHLSLYNSRIIFYVNKTNSSELSVSSRFDVSANTLYRLVATYKNGEKLKLYIYNDSGVLLGKSESASVLDVGTPVPVMDNGFIGRSRRPYTVSENRSFDGKISDLAIFNKALNADEVKAISKPRQFSFLESADIAPGGFYFLESSKLSPSNFQLAFNRASFYIVDNSGNQIDKINYDSVDSRSSGSVYRALAPYSFGLFKDGLNTGGNTAFGHFSSPTKSSSNSGVGSTGNGVTINEIFLGARACTCVPKPACSQEGQERDCPPINNCAQKQVCRGGSWTQCQAVSDACYLPAPQATQAVFSWAFMMHANNGNDWPYVVEDCNRNLSCDPKDRLPSPTPWYIPGAEGWSTEYSGVSNPSACQNAIISARFSVKMLESSFIANDTVKVLKMVSSTWELVDVSGLTFEDSGKQLKINVATLTPSTTYKVILTDSIKSYVGWPLKKTNATYNPLVDNRDCAINGITNTAYCWNFQTRADDDPDLKCKEGCPTCTPNPTKGGYYGDENTNDANLDSRDNVCLMLNPWAYNWNWTIGTTTKESVTNLRLFGWNVASSTLSTSSNDDFVDPRQTSTALGQTIFDSVTTTIDATLVESGKKGVCIVKNDFTNPYVVINSNCNASSTPSPSPQPGARDVCLNAAVMGRFNLDMFDASVVNGTSHPNLIVQKCGNQTSTATSSPVSGGACIDVTDWTFEIFPYSHSELTLEEMITHPENTSNTPEGFLAYPNSTSRLDSNTWYRVIVKGADDGVHSASNTPSGTTENPQGILINTNFPEDNSLPPDYYWIFKTGKGLCKVDYVDVSPSNYFMSYAGLNQQYTAIPYSCSKGNAGVSTGVVLNPNSFTWKWQSLLKLTDDINESDTTGGTGISIANICPFVTGSMTNCGTYNSTITTGHMVSVFGVKEGPIVDIKARATNTHTEGKLWNSPWPDGDKFDFGKLKVGSGNNFSINSRFPGNTACSNPDIKLSFSEEASSTSLSLNSGGNIKLYKCTDLINDPDCNSSFTLSSMTGFYPAGSNPVFSNLMIAKTSNLSSGKYRVMVFGGSGAGNPYIGGVQSWSGDGLNNLNFKPFSNISGEACEPGVYPWNTQNGICSSANCTLQGNLCDTRFSQCTIASIGVGYCNATCHNLGNNNIASCGNSKVELGEDCDLGAVNGATSSPCSVSCLWRGSNKNEYGSLCGNAKIEKGEQCDEGNINNGDGCSSSCLYEDLYASSTNASSTYKNFGCGVNNYTTTTVSIGGKNVIANIACDTPGENGCSLNCKNIGSTFNVPVCGNKIVEKGEQCDDGNKISGDGCEGTVGGNKGCLWEGTASGGECGNNIIENGQNNYYSWVFDVANNPEDCNPVDITLNPCPNGIWQTVLDKAISSSTVVIQRGYKNVSSNPDPGSCVITTDFSSLSLLQKVIKRVKLIARDFLGIKLAIAENYWCEISNESYDFNELHAIDLGNFEATTTIDGTNNNRTLAFPNQDDNRVINYIRNSDWATGTPYRMIVAYSRDNISDMVETSTQVINTFWNPSDYNYNSSSSKCSIKKVEVNVWPKGETKNFDAFFCRGDNCGLDTSGDLYDDDISAEWNQRYKIAGHSGFLSGNQHLYRAWAYTNIQDKYLVRANFSDFSMISIPYDVGTARAEFSSTTYYNGGSWITSGQKDGRTNLYIEANNSINDSIANRANETVVIGNMSCKNPWPSVQNPRFLDSRINCATVGGCVNTNFETWYCRDAGIEDICVGGNNAGNICKTNSDCIGGTCQLYTADDLPSIGTYDNISGKWTAAITGLGTTTCPNLPDSFVPRVGYYDFNSTSTYLWNAQGVVYKSTASGGWVMLSRGDLAEKGLPANFGPTVGYYNQATSRVQLWDYDGNLYEYNAGRWSNRKDISRGLPKGFRPVGGYFWESGNLVGLWDGSGKLLNYNVNTDKWGPLNPAGIVTPVSWEIPAGGTRVIPTIAYNTDKPSGVSVQMWDNKGNLFNYDPWAAATRPTPAQGLPVTFKPDVGYFDGTYITLWDGQLSYRSSDGITYESSKQFEKTCDRKVKEFLFVSNNVAPVQSLKASDAIYIPSGVVRLRLGGVWQGWDWNYRTSGTPITFKVNAPWSGQYSLSLDTSNDTNINYPANIPTNCKQNDKVYHNMEIYVDGTTTSNTIGTIKSLASNPSDIQTSRTASFNLTKGNHDIIIHWTNDCIFLGQFNSNLIIYGLKLYSYDSDAIGIRIMTNNNHYSPYYWYANTFNGGQEVKGLNINDYSAVQEGRTVYVNATDLNTTTPKNIFGDIFLMSYNQGAGGNTVNIYNQMLNNWRFNAGASDTGGLDDLVGLCSNTINYTCVVNGDCGEKYSSQPNLRQNLGTCVNKAKGQSACSIGFKPPCISDSDCQKMGAGYCNSPKASLVRDTKRLSDIQDINFLLNNFYNRKRCSNDQYRLCSDSQDCYGGGTCSNYYPSLDAGTYIAGRTFSTWPSWQDNLSKLLGYGLPIDPINKFFGCVSPYDLTTCWDSESKMMSKGEIAGSGVGIQSSSSVYYYKTVGKGTGYELFVHGEYDSTGNRWMPFWESVNLMRYNPFAGYQTESMWRANTNCGDGICNDGGVGGNHGPIVGGSPEDCSTCWTDCGCSLSGGPSDCRPTSTPAGAYVCQDPNICGDNVEGGLEACDLGVDNGTGKGCEIDCQCQSGWNCDITPAPVCGDGRTLGGEKCDFPNGLTGIPSCGFMGCCGLPGSDWQCQQITEVVCGNAPGTCNILVSCPPGYEEAYPCSYQTPTTDCRKGCKRIGVEVVSCEGVVNPSVCEPKDCTALFGSNWYTQVPCNAVVGSGCQQTCAEYKCGDGVKDGPTETCDCGTFAGIVPLNNPFICPFNNINNPSMYLTGTYIPGFTPVPANYQYCNASCQSQTANKLFCGDNVFTNPPEECDKKTQINMCGGIATCENLCTTSCTKDPIAGGCLNGCCWQAGDGRCDATCGETHVANTCDDCAGSTDPLANASGSCRYGVDVCCVSNCNWMPVGSYDGANYCGIGGRPTDCTGADWVANWTAFNDTGLTGDTCKMIQSRTCTTGTVGSSDPVCDPRRNPALRCVTATETRNVDTGRVDNNGYCCRNNGEYFVNESACSVLIGNRITLRSTNGSQTEFVNKSGDEIITSDNGTSKMTFNLHNISDSLHILTYTDGGSTQYAVNEGGKMRLKDAWPDKFQGYYFADPIYKGGEYCVSFIWNGSSKYIDPNLAGDNAVIKESDSCNQKFTICDEAGNCSF